MSTRSPAAAFHDEARTVPGGGSLWMTALAVVSTMSGVSSSPPVRRASAAMRAAKTGMEVAMVDEKVMVGGNCAHLGTIPSKALRHAVQQIIRFNTDALFRDIGEPRTFSFPKVLKRAESVIAKQVKLRTSFYARNQVKLYHGQGRFTDAHTMEVVKADGSIETLIADKFVITTGSRPYRPVDVNFDNPRVYDSDTILKLQHTPRKIVIYGAGVIGCEYASIFCGLGVRVELINT